MEEAHKHCADNPCREGEAGEVGGQETESSDAAQNKYRIENIEE